MIEAGVAIRQLQRHADQARRGRKIRRRLFHDLGKKGFVVMDCIVELALLFQFGRQIQISLGPRRIDRERLLPAQFGFVGMSELLSEDAVIYQQIYILGRKLEPVAGKPIGLVKPLLLTQVSQPGIARGRIGRVGLDRILPGSDGILGITFLQSLARQAYLDWSVVRCQ